MVFTVNSNAGAFAALQNKSKANQQLAAKQDSVGGGLGVRAANAEETAFAIEASGGDLGGLSAVKGALDRASSAVDVAGAAADKVAGLLEELQANARSAESEDLSEKDRQALDAEFSKLKDQITQTVEEASFDGINAVGAKGQAITAIVSETADRVLEIPAQNLSLGGPNVTLKADQGIETAEAAKAAGEALQASRQNVDGVRFNLSDGSSRIEAQRSFVEKLSTTVEEGLGNLVDTGMERETANLQALQVKQQLGLQPLSIANQSPQAILSLLK